MSGAGKVYTVDGIVLRQSNYGENDTLFTVLTADRGRVTLIAKGARSLKSAVRAAVEPFTFGNYEVSDKGGLAWLRAGVVNESFLGLRSNLTALSAASYFCDVAYELSGEEMPAGELLQLLLNALYLLSYRIPPDDSEAVMKAKAAFEIRAMTISGYAPDLSRCTWCGTTDGDRWYLDVMNGSIICGDCMHRHASIRYGNDDPHDTGSATILQPITRAAMDAMRYVIEAPPKRVFAFRLPDVDSRNDFERTAESYLKNHLERTFDSLEFFHRMQLP